MSAAALAQTILAFVAIVGVGAVLRATGLVESTGARPLNAVIVYAGLPAFIFRAVHQARLDPGLIRVVAVAWIVFGLMLALGFLGARLLRLPRAVAGGFIIATALGNTGYLGYPLTAALFGDAGLPPAVFYDVFCTATALVLIGFPIAHRFGVQSRPRAHPLRELIAFPPVIALAAGLALHPVPLPEAVMFGLDTLANMVAPLVMLTVGLSLRPRSALGMAAPLGAVVGARMVVAPLLALGLGTVLIGGGDTLRIVVLEAGMPTMMLTLVAAERFGLDTDFVASAIFLSTVVAAVALPALQLLTG